MHISTINKYEIISLKKIKRRIWEDLGQIRIKEMRYDHILLSHLIK